MRNRGLILMAMLGVVTFDGARAASPESQAAVAAIAAYRDADFIGGLKIDALDLARQTADAIGAELGPARECAADAALPSLAEARAARTGESENILLPNPLRPLTDLLDNGTPVQRAIVARAIGLIGPRADATRVWLAGGHGRRDAWSAQALQRVMCDAPAAAAGPLVDAQHMPAAGRDYLCDVPRANWLLTTVIGDERRWPAPSIEAMWGGLVMHCAGGQVPLLDTPAVIARFERALGDERYDREDRLTQLRLLRDLGRSGAPLLEQVQRYTQVDDATLRDAAQRALIATGTVEGANEFARRVRSNDYAPEAWQRDAAPVLHRLDQILPALAERAIDARGEYRRAAVEVLGDTQSARAVPALRAALSANDWPSTQAAVNALAGLVDRSDEARDALASVARDYWSPRIRDMAARAIGGGDGRVSFVSDCARSRSGLTRANSASFAQSLEQGEDCSRPCQDCETRHGLAMCSDGTLSSGTYRTADGREVQIEWRDATRRSFPRVARDAVSPWCGDKTRADVQDVDDGWLMGCTGEGMSGGLAYVPSHGEAKAKAIATVDVSLVQAIGKRVYVAGRNAYEFAQAGALYEALRDASGEWSLKPLVALPAPPDAVAVLDQAIAFADERNAVLIDPRGEMSVLTCAH